MRERADQPYSLCSHAVCRSLSKEYIVVCQKNPKNHREAIQAVRVLHISQSVKEHDAEYVYKNDRNTENHTHNNNNNKKNAVTCYLKMLT